MEEFQIRRGPGRPPKQVSESAPKPAVDGESTASVVEQKPAPQPVVRSEGNEALQSRLRSMELQLQAISGRRESRDEVFDKAREIVDRIKGARLKSGVNQWRVHNSRYRDAAGDPVTHEFWSDASDPESARADYNRRNGRYWSPDEGDDPLKFELIVEQ